MKASSLPDVRLEHTLPPATEVAALFAVAGLHGPLNDEPRMQRMLESSQQILVARHGQQVVGLVRVLTDFSFNAFIADLAVHPEFQRRGIGSGLVRAALEGQDGVKFVVHPGHDSGPFWASQGFEPTPSCLLRPRRG